MHKRPCPAFHTVVEVVLAALLASGTFAPPAKAAPVRRTPRAAASRWARFARETDRVDSLRCAGEIPQAFALCDSLLARATREPDRDLRIVATAARGGLVGVVGGIRTARAPLERLRLELLADRDTIGLCVVANTLGLGEQIARRDSAARHEFEMARNLARRARLPGALATAENGLGFVAFDEGDAAAAGRHHARALALVGARGNAYVRDFARAGYARALSACGHADAARREFRRCIAESRACDDRFHEADSRTDLAGIELTAGEPALAAEDFRTALGLYRPMHWDQRIASTAHSLAVVAVSLGRLDEADSALASALPIAERSANRETGALLLSEFGVVRRQQLRFEEAIELGARAVAVADSFAPPDLRAIIVSTDVATLQQAGRPGEALDLLESELVKFGGRAPAIRRLALLVTRATLLRIVGRPRAALIALLEAERVAPLDPSGTAGVEAIGIRAERGCCYRDLGIADSARASFEQAAELWERWRASTSDPGWREAYDDESETFSGEWAALLLDPRRGGTTQARAGDAFAALQRFRARTLAERMVDADARHASPSHRLSLAEVQARALQPGEVLLDVHALPETTFVFAVSRAGICAYGLARRTALGKGLQQHQALVTDKHPDAAALAAQVSAALGTECLGPAAELIAPARRVFIVSGGMPLGAFDRLVLPGEERPLGDGREVVEVPSAALLESMRSTPPPSAARALLAVAQSEPWQGAALPGAREEVIGLSHMFASADACVDHDVYRARDLAPRWGEYEVLHIAAHSRSVGLRAWQTALQIGSVHDDGAWLTAAEIAQLRIHARLCVLAGCHTLAAGLWASETQRGLASAWLAAGARAVIATSWAVDDAATAALMRRFYARLAGGATAAAALHGAQDDIRRMPRFAAPYYWAGVRLVGDPDVRVRLSPRDARTPRVTNAPLVRSHG